MVDAGTGESPCDPSRIILDSRPKDRSRATALADKAAHDCLHAVSPRIIDTKSIKSKTSKKPVSPFRCTERSRRRSRSAPRASGNRQHEFVTRLRDEAPPLQASASHPRRNSIAAWSDASRPIPAMYTLSCTVKVRSATHRNFSHNPFRCGIGYSSDIASINGGGLHVPAIDPARVPSIGSDPENTHLLVNTKRAERRNRALRLATSTSSWCPASDGRHGPNP